jgi:hypothetical protein
LLESLQPLHCPVTGCLWRGVSRSAQRPPAPSRPAAARRRFALSKRSPLLRCAIMRSRRPPPPSLASRGVLIPPTTRGGSSCCATISAGANCTGAASAARRRGGRWHCSCGRPEVLLRVDLLPQGSLARDIRALSTLRAEEEASTPRPAESAMARSAAVFARHIAGKGACGGGGHSRGQHSQENSRAAWCRRRRAAAPGIDWFASRRMRRKTHMRAVTRCFQGRAE